MMTSLILTNPDPVLGSFRIWRPFVVREDLVPLRRGWKNVLFTAYGLKEYVPDSRDLGLSLKLGKEQEGKSWSEFQLGSVRFRFSRYQDFLPPTNSSETNKADNTWDMVKSLPAQLGSSPNRAALEAMGKIFTPHLNLGIEF